MKGEMNGRHILRKPMLAGEFFRKICSILKEKGSMPDILDYSMAVFLRVLRDLCHFRQKRGKMEKCYDSCISSRDSRRMHKAVWKGA